MDTTRRAFIRSTVLGSFAGYLGIEMLAHNSLDLNPRIEHGEGFQEPPKQQETNKYLDKIRNFDNDFREDVYLDNKEFEILLSTSKRLERVQSYVGYGNFNLISFDTTLAYASRVSSIGEFATPELAMIERLFDSDASKLGFFGEKVINSLTSNIKQKDVQKIPRSGHYIFRGDAEKLYQKIAKDLGESIILTSGIRSVVKQVHLFMSKAVKTEGNLSRASRSLAPPGHSYHGIGDFDVGKRGFGYLNFTEKFSTTDEYKRLIDLGYVNIRYSDNNPYGVRFEPWHIKVI